MQEQDPSIFPRISITHVGEWIASHLSFLPSVPLASHGDHLPNTGAAPMLDQLTFDYPKRPDADL